MRGDYRELRVWQGARVLAGELYGFAGKLPASEKYELASQIRRAAVSVPANIAEGHGRLSTREFRHHLGIARGSLAELETLLQLSADFRLVEAGIVAGLIERCCALRRQLMALLASIDSGRLGEDTSAYDVDALESTTAVESRTNDQ